MAAALVILVAAVCVRLGFWQLDRLEQRRAVNAAIMEGLTLPPAPLSSALLDSIARDPEAFAYRRVVAEGSYLEPAFLLRGRSLEGRPGIHLISPFRPVDSRQILLINRGWLPASDGATADPAPFHNPGAATLRGVLMPIPSLGLESVPLAVNVGGHEYDSFLRLDPQALEETAGAPVLPVVLQLMAAGGATEPLPVLLPVPQPAEGPHLGYALQWFGFALVALIGFAVTVVTRRRGGLARP